MIVSYTDRFPNTIEFVRRLTGENLIFRSENDPKNPLFSETPYVLVFDGAAQKTRAVRRAIAKETFTGSKILYCLFLTDDGEFFVDRSAAIASKKDFVLFGSEKISAPHDKLSAAEANKLLSVSASILSRCFIGGKLEKQSVDKKARSNKAVTRKSFEGD